MLEKWISTPGKAFWGEVGVMGTEGETAGTGLAGFSSSQVCVFNEGLI